jgi:uncharacterized protein (DUF1330 family)
MKGYVIAHVDVRDPDGYKLYTDQTPGVVEAYGGRFIVRGAPVERLEGDTDWKRVVVLEFPSLERARAWYESPEYQEILPFRQAASSADFILVEGCEAPPLAGQGDHI